MLLESIYSNMRSMIVGSTVKFNAEATKNETLETTRKADRYINAVTGIDTWRTYSSFDEIAFNRVGIFDVKLIEKYMEDKELIPMESRNRLVEEQRKYIIESYVEENDYYRALSGLPDKGEQPLFVDPEIAELVGVDNLTPIHELLSEDLVKLSRQGYLTELQEKYPKKAYLRFLMRPIPPVVSRQAVQFALIQTPTDVPLSFYENFVDTYEKARAYFMSVIYNRNYSSRFDLYDNYIGMMIMTMTVQRMFTDLFRSGVENDFYDLETIQLFFNSYNVPFIENLPLEYQRVLVRNMNNLLYYKSTDKVLYDICSLLGYERINIYKYYLMKEHRLDENEQPLFIYKTEQLPDGTEIQVEDSEQMFNLYFQSVELRERNTALHLTNSTNRIEYNQVVIDDIFWWDDDDELKKKIYESEFNFVESKYLSMNIMYKMTEMLFEIIYTFRIILDKKDRTTNMTITLPRVLPQKDLTMFDTVVLLCALISKKTNMAGNILASPTKIMSIMGFNFKADFAAIRQEIRNNPKVYDQKILDYLLFLDVYNPEDINRLFVNMRELELFLADKILNTPSLESYHAYKKLYDTLLVSETTDIIFKKSNGEIATTFLDYLEDQDIILAELVNSTPVQEISELINTILNRLTALLKDLRHLYIVNDSNNVVIDAITKLIRFFKSYTTDLTSLNVMYLMDSKYFNSIRTLDHLEKLQTVIHPKMRGKLPAYKPRMLVRMSATDSDKLQYVLGKAVLLRKKSSTPITDKLTRTNQVLVKRNQNLTNKRMLRKVSSLQTTTQWTEHQRAILAMRYAQTNKFTMKEKTRDVRRIALEKDQLLIDDRQQLVQLRENNMDVLRHSMSIQQNWNY